MGRSFGEYWLKLRLLPGALNKKDRWLLAVLFVIFVVSSIYLTASFYIAVTIEQPSFGGIYREGISGQPRFLNPIYSQASDADRDLVELMFAGLMKYDPKGQLVPDLAESYRIAEDGKVYEFTLKDSLWHDGQKITADDVLFTIKTLQDPAIQSPLRGNWLGVEVEKISDNKVSFRLRKPYAAFLELANVKILPQHIWRSISPENFPLSNLNLKDAVGSGPYKLKTVTQEKSGRISLIELERNGKYFGQKPFLDYIVFYFFNSEQELIAAAQSQNIDGFSPQLAKNYILPNFKIYHLELPRYFAVFFNSDKSPILKQKEVREALNYSTDTKEIIDKVFGGSASKVTSPVLPDIFGLKEPSLVYEFNTALAKKLLDDAGFKIDPETGMRVKKSSKESAFRLSSDLNPGSSGKAVEELQKCLAKDPEIYPDGKVTGYFGDQTKEAVIKFQEKYSQEILAPSSLQRGNGKVGPATRQKLNALCFSKTEENMPLNISLAVPNEPPLSTISHVLRDQWQNVGINLSITEYDPQDLIREVVRTREYEALLFGQVLGSIPDPLPFWHSTQKRDPGLNLTSFSSKESDEQLTKIRELGDPESIKSSLEKLQDIVLKEVPALFLVNPDYLYFVSPKIKGLEDYFIVDPSKRFTDVQNWYIKTRRVLR